MAQVRLGHHRVLAHDEHGLDAPIAGGAYDLGRGQPAFWFGGAAPLRCKFRHDLWLVDFLVAGKVPGHGARV